MTHFPPESSNYKRVWVRDLPQKYQDDWDQLGLVKPPVNRDGLTIRSVPFYAAQQLHRINKIPRQLRGATKPVVVTTSKIGEPFYLPQLDFDARPNRPIPLTYNNLLDPHLKHYFNNPAKRRVLEKAGFITNTGDVICHSMKELNQYRNMLYWNYSDMLKSLRTDMDQYMPRILAKRRAIAEVTSENRRYNILRDKSRSGKSRMKLKRKPASSGSKTSKRVRSSRVSIGSEKGRTTPPQYRDIKPSIRISSAEFIPSEEPTPAQEIAATKIQAAYRGYLVRKHPPEQERAAVKIQATYRGYQVRRRLAQEYRQHWREQLAERYGERKKIWLRGRDDHTGSSCHTHSCTEKLTHNFEITDLPAMMKFLKDPVAQPAYRRNFLLRLMHTPGMDISGTMVKPLLKEEIKRHSSKFRWV